jgi:hypothetical protein
MDGCPPKLTGSSYRIRKVYLKKPRDPEILLEYLEEAATEFKQEGKRFFTLFQYEGENKAKMCETLESAGVFSLEIDIK